MSIIVNIAMATICFNTPIECHNALVGVSTPTGTFNTYQLLTDQSGYGGDVLVFKDNERAWWAIHRVYLLNKAQKRDARLKSSNPADRIITNGCVNVEDEVYERLIDCCASDTVIIKK